MSGLVHVSLFSGIDGIGLAMERAGVPTVLRCEFDTAAAGALADRFPGTPIHPDVRTLTGDHLRRLADPGRTVLSAGFPCQDLSVAGARRGMVQGSGTRSALFWEVDRLLAEFAPTWVVLENVPGLLSSRGGRDMGAVLGSLAQRGYGFAYRVLDARHFGVPQRRRRVVVVGHLGDDGSAPAQVLLEPEGLRGNPAASESQGPITAARAGGRATAGRVTRALTTRSGAVFDDQQVDQLVIGVLGDHTHALTAEGHDASEDGTGRGTPIVAAPTVAATLSAGTSGRGVSAPGRRQEDDHNVVAFDPKAGGDRTSSGAFEDGTGITPTLGGARPHAVAFHMTQDPISGAVSPAIGAKSGGMGIAYAAEQTVSLDTTQGGPDDNSAQGGHLVATFQKVIRSGARDVDGNLPPEVWAHRDVAATLNLNDLGSESRAVEVDGHLDSPVAVRRLTPTECERLQGYPDGWTATSGGKTQADSPRYKQLGNSVAVPVFEWVARRIVAVDAHLAERAA